MALNRREFTISSLHLFAASTVLPGCPQGDDDSAATDDDSVADDDTNSDDDTAGDDDSSSSSWADGGAAAIGNDYPDPFTGDDPDACELLCSAVLGPCYGTTFERKDISEGQPGLPMRIAFRVVDEQCNPVPDAEVDIWHTDVRGTYSGEDTVAMCTGGDELAESGHFFRGIQRSDAGGRADFDSCFPGWYPSRAIHIHFTVRRGDTAYLTSQLYFDTALIDDVLANHPAYEDRGLAQTRNEEDGILPQDNAAKYTFSWARMDDGVLMVWKTLVLRANVADPLCAE